MPKETGKITSTGVSHSVRVQFSPETQRRAQESISQEGLGGVAPPRRRFLSMIGLSWLTGWMPRLGISAAATIPFAEESMAAQSKKKVHAQERIAQERIAQEGIARQRRNK